MPTCTPRHVFLTANSSLLSVCLHYWVKLRPLTPINHQHIHHGIWHHSGNKAHRTPLETVFFFFLFIFNTFKKHHFIFYLFIFFPVCSLRLLFKIQGTGCYPSYQRLTVKTARNTAVMCSQNGPNQLLLNPPHWRITTA